jgi:hypothetical protein
MTPRPLRHYAWLSIAAALATMALKGAAWWLTDSVGLLSDALESLVNLAGGVMTLAMITVAARPADDGHAFGHSKAEYFASGFEGMLILLAAAGIAPRRCSGSCIPESSSSSASGCRLGRGVGDQLRGRRRAAARGASPRLDRAGSGRKHLLTDV